MATEAKSHLTDERTPSQKYPKSPLPAQHQERPGIEAEMSPRPEYLAPHYKGAEN